MLANKQSHIINKSIHPLILELHINIYLHMAHDTADPAHNNCSLDLALTSPC